MKAKIAPRSEEDRQILRNVLPVNTPYVINIFTGDICNFKCIYCINSVEEKKMENKNTLSKEMLSWDSFKNIADQICEFPEPIKKVLLTSIGEPLLNKKLPEMIAYLKQTGRVNTIEIITNGSLLTPELSNKLIDAGLDRLGISIQGTTSKKYKDICGANIDIDEMIKNIKYFYDNRKQCNMFIKTVDIALENETDKERFMNLFSNICDQIYIDNIIPLYEGVNYEDMNLKEGKTLHNKKLIKIDICSQAFYTIDIRANGNVVPCCQEPYPISFGNIKEKNLIDIWNSNKRKDFLIMMLKKEKNQYPICKKCVMPSMATADEKDILDGYEKEILDRLV